MIPPEQDPSDTPEQRALLEKRSLLIVEIEQKRDRELSLARWSHWLNIGAMVLTLVATAIAVGYGVGASRSSQITAGLALLPGGIALLATALKFEARCNWHYQKAYGLDKLFRKLRIELPEIPTQEQITVVSVALGNLEADSEAAWEATLALDWSRFRKDH